MPRIALIHALAASVAPINEALARDWPQAVRMNVLDDSLSADLAHTGRLDATMTRRFEQLADYAVAAGADAILFTCSAFGACIDAVKLRHAGFLVLKPNEAMVAEAAELSRRLPGPVGLVASFAPTLTSMPHEFPADVAVRTALADEALSALQCGDTAGHDAAAARAAAGLVEQHGCVVIALAQFSLARAAPAVAAACGVPVLTTVDSAVRRLRWLLG